MCSMYVPILPPYRTCHLRNLGYLPRFPRQVVARHIKVKADELIRTYLRVFISSNPTLPSTEHVPLKS